MTNEPVIAFDNIRFDTTDVFEAVGTQCCLIKFKLGVVGGHCIGVDRYYPTHKVEMPGNLRCL